MRASLPLLMLTICLGSLPQASGAADDSPTTVIRAADFGAKGDGTHDNGEAIRAALAACRGKSHPRLVVEPGTYRFAPETLPPSRRAFDVVGIDDLVIDGQGATLLFSGPATPFYFERCLRPTLRNVKVDWDRVPFSQGKVIASTEDSLDVQVDADYPITGQEKIEALMDYDPGTRLPLANLDVFGSAITAVAPLGPQTLRITLKHYPTDAVKEAHRRKYLQAAAGKFVVLRHAVYGHYGVDLDRCEDVRLEHVSIYACPGMGIHASLCHNIACDHVEVRIKPGSGRLMSTTADCQYYTFCTGRISLDHGFYEGMGDDGCNVTAKYRVLTRIDGLSSFHAAVPGKGWQGPAPVPGERLSFVGGDEMRHKGDAAVRTARWDEEARAFAVELDRPVEGLTARDMFYSETYLPQVRITRSTFQGMRSRAILLHTRDAQVSDCLIRGPGYCGILLVGGLRHNVEGPAPTNVRIENCTFEGCGGAAIYGYADNMDRAAGVLADLRITGNTIRDLPTLSAQRFARQHPNWMHWAAAICLVSARDAQIAGNTFEGCRTALYLRHDDTVAMRGNRSTAPSPVIVDEATCANITLDADNHGLDRTPSKPDIEPDLQYVNDLR